MRKGILRKRILEGQFRKGIAEGHFRKGIAEGHFRKGRKGTVHKLEFLPKIFSRPTSGFIEPREPPKQLSYHHGKIIVSDFHASILLFICSKLFRFHQAK